MTLDHCNAEDHAVCVCIYLCDSELEVSLPADVAKLDDPARGIVRIGIDRVNYALRRGCSLYVGGGDVGEIGRVGMLGLEGDCSRIDGFQSYDKVDHGGIEPRQVNGCGIGHGGILDENGLYRLYEFYVVVKVFHGVLPPV